jgi:hypothetical protein
MWSNVISLIGFYTLKARGGAFFTIAMIEVSIGGHPSFTQGTSLMTTGTSFGKLKFCRIQ